MRLVPVLVALRKRALATLLISASLCSISGCTVNPVTGESQLMFSSTASDIEIGNSQYKPAQQAQGGLYYLDPELTIYLRSVGNRLAAVSDQPHLPYEFVILNNSVPNAWALPSGKIAINRGLLVKLENEAQLAAVLAHEIVHSAARHGAQRMRDNLLLQVGMAGLGMGLADNDYRDLIIGGASLGASLTLAKYGRDHELESDYYGMQYMAKAGYDPNGAVELQKLFVALSQSRSGSWLDGLFASHPPSQERVEANIRTAQALQQEQYTLGHTPYQQAIAYLKSKTPAYELADKAAKQIADGKLESALKNIDSALKIEANEALFHSIKAQILDKQGQAQQALVHHNRATALYPEQFSYFLYRAESHLALGNDQAAQQDLQRSMALLPTSVAALALGQLFEQQGQTQKAIGLFSMAAEARGDAGQRAALRLATLELQSQPEKYLKPRHVQDPQGPLLVRIHNNSPVDVSRVALLTETFDAQGQRISADEWQLNSPLKAGQTSAYFPLKSVYHLPDGHRIRTSILKVDLAL